MGEGTDVGAEISGFSESLGEMYGFFEFVLLNMWSWSELLVGIYRKRPSR